METRKVKTSRNYFRYLVLITGIILTVLPSCGVKESIEPAYEAVSIDTQLEAKPIEVSLALEDLEIEEFGTEFSAVDQLGPVFQELAGHLANIAIAEENGQMVDIEPIIYYAYELDQIDDWSYFKKMGLKKIKLNIQKADDPEVATLDFIEEINIYADFKEPALGTLKREEGVGFLIASYNRENKVGELSPDGKSISLHIEDIAWMEILKKERVFTIYPELKVNKVPKTKMSVGGEVGVFVGLKLGI